VKIQLYSIHQTPANLPYWPSLMDDLCNPPADQVARVLGKSYRTICRYNATGFAPRVVCLAIFWLTSWGRNAVHTQAHNDAVSMAGLANSLRCERDDFKAETRRLRSKCDRLKVAIQRLRGELRIEIERPRRDRKSWSEAQIERSDRRRISGSQSQIETEWKVLLEPSPKTALLTPPEAAEPVDQVDAPKGRRFDMGRQGRARPPAAGTASKLSGPVAVGQALDAGALAFGSMFGALADRPASWLGEHESDVVDVHMPEHASEASAGRQSLPLADLDDARAGTPPSATALRAWKPAGRLVPLKTQPRRRASAK
jgi:hypothetical protein